MKCKDFCMFIIDIYLNYVCPNIDLAIHMLKRVLSAKQLFKAFHRSLVECTIKISLDIVEKSARPNESNMVATAIP